MSFTSNETVNLSELVKTRRQISAPPPNVIILLADDLGWADVGYRGSDIKHSEYRSLSKRGNALRAILCHSFLHADSCRSE